MGKRPFYHAAGGHIGHKEVGRPHLKEAEYALKLGGVGTGLFRPTGPFETCPLLASERSGAAKLWLSADSNFGDPKFRARAFRDRLANGRGLARYKGAA